MDSEMISSSSPDTRGLYRIAGASAILLGMSYVFITVLYVVTGALQGGAEDWLLHLSKHHMEWWGILGFSVLTDLLFIPITWAIYVSLKEVNRNLVLAGIVFLGLFLVLDLAVTWPNYSALITLGKKYAVSVIDTERIALIAAANYPFEVLSSKLFAVYAILVPALGLLLIGLVMLKGSYNRVTAYLGIITGILGVISVLGSFFSDAIAMGAILTSVFTTIWIFLVGFRLLGMSRLLKAGNH